MQNTLSTTDGTLDWADAREGDVIVVNETRLVIRRTDEGLLCTDAAALYAERWRSIGAFLEREVEEHPHGLIPTAYGAVIRFGINVYVRDTGAVDTPWFSFGEEHSDAAVQALADEHEFEVLWPRPKVTVTDEMVEEFAWKIVGELYPDSIPKDKTREVIGHFWQKIARAALETIPEGDDK